MTPAPSPAITFAAGGILSRETQMGSQVLLVHRRRYDDWTLPKGKLALHELPQDAALREVREETGCVAALGRFAGAIGYEVDQIPKVVFFWCMTVISEGSLTDHEEVDRTEWVSPSEAQDRLTHFQERSVLAQLLPPVSRPYHSPGDLSLKPWKRRWAWSQSERSHARLVREFEAYRVELAYREQRSQSAHHAWAQAARDQLENVRQYLDRRDTEGGWHCLHAAQRLTAFGLSSDELENQARILGAEATKLPSWRAAAVKDLLGAKPLTADRVCAAMALRDEYAANQYHKIWLMADQLAVLLRISISALVLLVVSLLLTPSDHTTWDYRFLSTVLLAGVLGAAFSAAQALISNSSPSKIPERVANSFVTTVRSLFGATAGLAGYVFLKSKLLNVTIGDDGTGAALAIAFLFGYTGERLIARIADSVGTESPHSS